MTETSLSGPQSVAIRFARLVAQVRADATAAAEHRKALRGIVKSLKTVQVVIGRDADGALLVDGAPIAATDAADGVAAGLLAARMLAFGLEEFTLAKSTADADLHDLARLLAIEPNQDDPSAFFAARATTIDPRGIPRRLTVRETVEPAPEIVEPTSAKRPKSGSIEAVNEPPSADPRDERIREALPLPATNDSELAALFQKLVAIETAAHLAVPLETLTSRADLAFRTGRFDAMIDALAGLVSVEFTQLERDPSDDRRREFAQAARALAKPPILRQLAVLRHERAGDPTRVQQLQAILSRFGTDGVEALIDEFASASTELARAHCLTALKDLRRTHDALFELARDTRDLVVRQAARLLGALGDERAEEMLIELLRHPDARTRRSAVAALERFASPVSLEALGLALLDESAMVRLRTVAALTARGGDVAVRVLLPLLDNDAEREVRYAAVAALGTLGTPDAIQALIRCAQGDTDKGKKYSAQFRLLACRALVVIRTPQTMAAVQMLRDDRDKEVRAGAVRLVAQAARRTTSSMRAVSAP